MRRHRPLAFERGGRYSAYLQCPGLGRRAAALKEQWTQAAPLISAVTDAGTMAACLLSTPPLERHRGPADAAGSLPPSPREGPLTEFDDLPGRRWRLQHARNLAASVETSLAAHSPRAGVIPRDARLLRTPSGPPCEAKPGFAPGPFRSGIFRPFGQKGCSSLRAVTALPGLQGLAVHPSTTPGWRRLLIPFTVSFRLQSRDGKAL
jgi:hypothetical protein